MILEKKNPITDETSCTICDFLLDPQCDQGWIDHVIKSVYLFLSNIYGQEQMKTMEMKK